MAETDSAGHIAAVHAHLEGMPLVHQRKKPRHAGVVDSQHIRRCSLPRRLVQQEDHRVDPGGEIVALQTRNGLIDAVFAQHIVDVGLDARLQQHLNGVARVLTAIPAHRHRAAILLAQPRKLRRQAVAGGGEVGDQHILPADLQDLLKVLVLVGVAPAAQRKLVASALGLAGDPAEVLHGHVGLLHQQAALVAADSRLGAEPGFAVDAVSHDPHIDQMGVGCHERINAGVFSGFIQNTGTDIRARLRVKGGFEMALLVLDDVFHSFPRCKKICAAIRKLHYIWRYSKRQGKKRLFVCI